jgi:hypothetical protein
MIAWAHGRLERILNFSFPEFRHFTKSRKYFEAPKNWSKVNAWLPDPDLNHYRLSNAQKIVNAKGEKAQFGGFNFTYREAIKGNNDSAYGGGYAFNDTYNATAIINGLRGSLGNLLLPLRPL